MSDTDIKFVHFPSHTTHVMQPLNVDVCKLLKEGLGKELAKLMKTLREI